MTRPGDRPLCGLPTLACAFALAGCAPGASGPPPIRRPSPPPASAPPSTNASTPGWCRAATTALDRTDLELSSSLVAEDSQRLRAVAERLGQEADALEQAARANDAASVVEFAARGSNLFAGFVHLLESRKLAKATFDADAFEKAFQVASRHRAYLSMHVRAHCGEPLHDGEPTEPWRREMEARFETIRTNLLDCREIVHAAARDLPEQLELRARLDAGGRIVLVAPTSLEIAPLSLAAMGAIHCLVEGVERVSLPAPRTALTLAIRVELAGPHAVLVQRSVPPCSPAPSRTLAPCGSPPG